MPHTDAHAAEDAWSLATIRVIFACSIGNIVSSTAVINCTFSAFLLPVTKDLGWSRSAFSFVLTIISLIGVVAYPFAGRLMDRFGARPVVLAGNLLFGSSLVAVSFITPNKALTYLTFSVLGVAAALPSTVLLARVVSTWFHYRRGVALGVSVGVALGVGGTVMPLIAQHLIDVYQWRGAYRGLAAIVVVLGFPILFSMLREAPRFLRAQSARTAGATQRALVGMELRDAVRTAPFWLLLSSVSMGAGSLTAVATHVAALLAEHHISANIAAWTVAAMSFINAVWQIVLGRVLDRSIVPRIAAPFVLVAIAGVALLSFSTEPAFVILGGALMGIGSGTEYGLLPYCMPRYFGFRSYGVIYGWIFGTIMVVTGATPFFMDVLYERTGSYQLVLAIISVALVLCAVAVAQLPRYLYAPSTATAA